jgi:hypothetical protein
VLSGLAVSRIVLVAALAAMVPAIAGCSGGSGGGGSGLETALARVADTANNRTEIFYDDTSELVKVAGASPLATKGFALLRGMGAVPLESVFINPQQAGLNLFGENYAVTAGSEPRILTMMAGGQSASQVTSHLTKLGWKHSGGRLLAPKSANASEYELALDQVQPSGTDVLIGGSGADLGQIGAPSGQTLASDPDISALASCLGNVAAAEIFSGVGSGSIKPTAVAVGVSQPASNTATPQAVTCVSWPTQAAATAYAAKLRTALASGASANAGKRYSALLRDASVTTPGGSQNVVEWQADTPGNASEVFDMVDELGLPALTLG